LPQQAFDTVIVRFGGEIGIKALWTRKQYERRLTSNIKAALKHHAIQCSAFVKKAGRLYIKTDRAAEATEKLSQIFGVSSSSPAIETSSQLDDILTTSAELAGSQFKLGKSFAVRCRRVGTHLYTSQDVCVKVGERINASLPDLKLHVDLTRPEQTLQVEVREEKAYLFTNTVKGVGGLPLGTQPKLVCLLKGDVQSTVACWMTMKRGCPPVLVHFGEPSLIQRRSNAEQAVALAQKLMEWNIGFPRKLHVIENSSPFQRLTQTSPSELVSLVHKRLMFRIAQRIAEAIGAEGIVTGDSLENDAKHAVHAINLHDEAVRGFPIYRPLLGFDAAVIAEMAVMVGLKEAAPRRKKNRAKVKQVKVSQIKLEDVRRIENKLNIEMLVGDAVKSLRVLKI